MKPVGDIMRKFVISDIHGYGNLYYSVMGYLDNISKYEEIELYINGDLIDRGLESAEILLDIKKRIEDNKYKIIYLGGNHELLMYKEFNKRKKGLSSYYNDWYHNGGYITDEGLYETLKDEDKIEEVVEFISNLKLYHKFNERIGNKEILLVHAASPLKVLDECNLKIKNNNELVSYLVWTREYEPLIPFRNRIGNKDYFTIIGHTPNRDSLGFSYHKKENYLNIDGGVAAYVMGEFKYNHFPLVEICNNFLKILTFNSNNEIICGTYFDIKHNDLFTEEELNKEKDFLNHNVKTKRLFINEDGIVSYWK